MNGFASRALILAAAAGISQASWAALNPLDLKAQYIQTHEVPGKPASASELCVIPVHFSGAKYSKKDSTREAQLCLLDAGKTAAICPKMNSTNPGTNFYTSATISIGELEENMCKGSDVEMQAKYKLSTSCSYAPSLLAYYHISRLLGNVLNVPVAVLRTMDLDRHLAIADRALDEIKDHDSLIFKTWSTLNKALKAKKSDLLFVDGFTQSYGALQRNPRGEVKYSEFFNKGEDRAVAFRDNNKIYKALTSSTLTVGREFNAANVQAFVQLRDAADMILMDTILSQQDRFGNVHRDVRYYYQVVNGDFSNVKTESDLEAIPEEYRAGALTINEMILKDNDCGVTKENRAKKAKLLQGVDEDHKGVAHINPETYKRLRSLVAELDKADVKDTFIRGLQFTEQNYADVRANAIEAAELLHQRCKSGDLKLDLDQDLYFSRQELPTTFSCD